MPRASVYLVRAAFIHLLLGFTLGAALLAQKGLPFAGALARLRPLHIEWLLGGWIAQLTIGVAWWIFPRVGLRRDVGGPAWRIWAAFVLLNGGVWMAGWSGAVGQATGRVMVLGGRVAELGAVVVFAFALWPRVRAGLAEM